MNKCVYLHKFQGVPFYVGRGTIERAYKLEKSKRSGKGTYRGEEYSKFVENCAFKIEVEVVADNLSENEAADIELSVYNKLISENVHLVNKRPPSKELSIDHNLVCEYLKYDENSPSGLVWIKGKFNGKQAGSRLGNQWRVKLLQKEYYCSRIICVLFGHSVLGKVVDHVNGNPMDNTIKNLRVTTQQVNMVNCKKKQHNTSGVTGVSLVNNGNAYRAYYVDLLGTVYKDFKIDTYGEEAFDLAVKFRQDGVNKMKSLGIEYSERHGN